MVDIRKRRRLQATAFESRPAIFTLRRPHAYGDREYRVVRQAFTSSIEIYACLTHCRKALYNGMTLMMRRSRFSR